MSKKYYLCLILLLTSVPNLSAQSNCYTPYADPQDTSILRAPGGYYLQTDPRIPIDHPAYYSPRYRAYPDCSIRTGRRTSRLPSRKRQRSCASPQGYRYRGGYQYNNYGYSNAYDQGRYDANHDYIWAIAAARAGRLLNQHSLLFDDGILLFRAGRYDQAAIKFLGAAEKNHASGAARLHAGHALFALGRVEEAANILERAFELSPSLAHKTYDLRDEYGDKRDFAQHLARLENFVAANPNHAGGLTLLGYVLFYSIGPSAAYPPLDRAAQLDANSTFIPKLLNLARMAHGPAEMNRYLDDNSNQNRQPSDASNGAWEQPATNNDVQQDQNRYTPAESAPRPAAQPTQEQQNTNDEQSPTDLRKTNRRLASLHSY